MGNPFKIKISADWRKLIMANYVVDPSTLLPYIPYGTELDFWDERCFVSLVGFLFANSKVNGIPIPFHQRFEEVNLRFYVMRREGDLLKRGVVFIRELVPKPAVTFVANNVFHEHYETARMQHQWPSVHNEQYVEYRWKKSGWHSLSIQSDLKAMPLVPGSKEEFFTEHYWGYTQLNPDTTLEYFVNHIPWETYGTRSHKIEVDFGKTYGKEFAFLNELRPESVFLAEGSEISLEKSKKIRRIT